MNYHDKLIRVSQFVEDNFDEASELVVALGLTVDDVVRLLPDVLVNNYDRFLEAYDDTEEEITYDEQEDDEFGEGWED